MKEYKSRLEYVEDVHAWLRKAPPKWRIISYMKWRRVRPKMEELARVLDKKEDNE